MKVLVLNGSPKQNSDTFRLTNEFLKGLNKDGTNEIKVIDVIKKNIKPCIGCFTCFNKESGVCVQKDDLNEILEDYKQSDVVIWSFPLYFYGMPSHLKAVLDRTLPLHKYKFKESNNKIYLDDLFELKNKKTIVISGCGFPKFCGNFEGLFESLKNAFEYETYFIKVFEAPLINAPKVQELIKPLLNKFYNAGIEFNNTKSISNETIHDLEIPILDKNIYMNIVNN